MDTCNYLWSQWSSDDLSAVFTYNVVSSNVLLTDDALVNNLGEIKFVANLKRAASTVSSADNSRKRAITDVDDDNDSVKKRLRSHVK